MLKYNISICTPSTSNTSFNLIKSSVHHQRSHLQAHAHTHTAIWSTLSTDTIHTTQSSIHLQKECKQSVVRQSQLVVVHLIARHCTTVHN